MLRGMLVGGVRMKKYIQTKLSYFFTTFCLVMLLGFVSTIIATNTAYAQGPSTACEPGSGGLSLFTPWYAYLEGEIDSEGNCRPVIDSDNLDSSIVKIFLAVVEFLTKIVGIVTFVWLLFGAVQFIVSQGEPEGIKNAKSTMANSLVGFVISVLAVTLVQFLGRTLS